MTNLVQSAFSSDARLTTVREGEKEREGGGGGGGERERERERERGERRNGK